MGDGELIEPVDVELDALHDEVTNRVLSDIVDMIHDIKILQEVYFDD